MRLLFRLFHHRTGGEILIVQYPGPTAGGRPGTGRRLRGKSLGPVMRRRLRGMQRRDACAVPVLKRIVTNSDKQSLVPRPRMSEEAVRQPMEHPGVAHRKREACGLCGDHARPRSPGVIKGDFAPIWQPVAQGCASREVLAYLCAIISLGVWYRPTPAARSCPCAAPLRAVHGRRRNHSAAGTSPVRINANDAGSGTLPGGVVPGAYSWPLAAIKVKSPSGCRKAFDV